MHIEKTSLDQMSIDKMSFIQIAFEPSGYNKFHWIKVIRKIAIWTNVVRKIGINTNDMFAKSHLTKWYRTNGTEHNSSLGQPL